MLSAEPVPPETMWGYQVGCWRPEPVKQTDRRHRVSPEEASLQTSSGGPPCSLPLCHLWIRGGWPPWCGWPLDASWRASGAMFVGHVAKKHNRLSTVSTSKPVTWSSSIWRRSLAICRRMPVGVTLSLPSSDINSARQVVAAAASISHTMHV